MIKAVIFDLDGTLVNSLADLAISTNYALTKFGFPPYELEDYKYLVGDGMVKLIERAIPDDKLNDQTFKDVFDCFMGYYRKHYLENTKEYDGISDLIENLTADGYKLAVVSNKADEMTKVIVSKLFGDKTFNAVTGKRDGYPTKPDATLTLKIINELGVTPKECVFVGDSGMDMATAVNSCSVPLGVTWGFRSTDELLRNGARHLANTPQEVFNIIKGLD